MKKLLLGGALALAAQSAWALGCSATSGAQTVALVELYTSEGCSSCPPADAFLASRRSAGLHAGQAVLLALHVDYWNYIGWTDPFSRKAFTERQRWLSDLAHTRTIYTPEFFVAGKELRNWEGGLNAAVARINAMPARAGIAIKLDAPAAAGLPVRIDAQGPPGAALHVALIQQSATSKVTAGENGGRTLKHAFVVRDWLAPTVLGKDGKASLARWLTLPPGATPDTMGVSAFVQTDQGDVLQALTLNACPAQAAKTL
ncbi:thioredoxin family protein [Massilia sp. CF038]|jgi:hypothetical protein|uniref:DUF1223 domain-containing protein n=1 Tax=Massilia sp. CF038 TaxID=1881045 RepID=UPI00092479CC|nr:DUF1223 domain-containing protein [Massilia sp. CF038]SHH18042.1 hypothetical protein SAMN05428948_3179 [Massilia sp. CF038]